jgi:hypothetical protein
VQTTNSAPILILKTKPAADNTTTPYPTIRGVVPLSVRFNLCPSDDVDQIYGPTGVQDPRGDSLNWQFNFGDFNSVLPVNPVTGKPQWDIDQFCRVDHVYASPGTFTAMVAVTDKHQEDQLSRGVAALARTTTFVTINAFPIAPPEPTTPPPVIVTFTVTGGCGWTLTWTTQNATSVSIVDSASNPVGTFGPNGSTASSSGTGTFKLTAIGPGGSVSSTKTGPICE